MKFIGALLLTAHRGQVFFVNYGAVREGYLRSFTVKAFLDLFQKPESGPPEVIHFPLKPSHHPACPLNQAGCNHTSSPGGNNKYNAQGKCPLRWCPDQ